MRAAKNRAKRMMGTGGVRGNKPKIKISSVPDTYAGRWTKDDPYETRFSSRHGGRVLTDTLRDEP